MEHKDFLEDELLKSAIIAALEIVAEEDPDKLIAGNTSFMERLVDGESIEVALGEAINIANPEADDVKKMEAFQKFWAIYQPETDEEVAEEESDEEQPAHNPQLKRAIELALDELTEEEAIWLMGRDKFFSLINQDPTNEDLEKALDEAIKIVSEKLETEGGIDSSLKLSAKDKFWTIYNASPKKPNEKKASKWGCIIPIMIFFFVLAVVFAFLIADEKAVQEQKQDKKQESPKSSNSVTYGTYAQNPDVVNAVLQANGWKPNEYVMGKDVKKEKDKSDPGNGAFSEQGARSPEEIVTFLKSGSDNSKKLLEQIIKKTRAKKTEILDPKNWIAIQATTPFNYPSNTMIGKNGSVVNVGSKNANAGEIFLIFISPTTAKASSVRGACNNTQDIIPTPKKPEVKQPKKVVPPPFVPEPTPEPIPTPIPQPERHHHHDKKVVTVPKEPKQDVLVNPQVADWKKEDPVTEPLKTVSNEDGAKVSNGLQDDPRQDAVEAEKAAKADDVSDAAASTATQQQAISTGSGVVDTNQVHTGPTTPPTDW